MDAVAEVLEKLIARIRAFHGRRFFHAWINLITLTISARVAVFVTATFITFFKCLERLLSPTDVR